MSIIFKPDIQILVYGGIWMKKKRLKITNYFVVLLAFILIMENTLSVYAKDDVNELMKEKLTEKQYYVYQLQKIWGNSEYNMNQTITSQDFFDRKTKYGIWDVLSLNSLGSAYFGDYEQKYYRKALAECVNVGFAEKTKSNTRLNETVLFSTEQLYDTYVKEYGGTGEFGVLLDGLDYIQEVGETGEVINKIAAYSGIYLNALELIKKRQDSKSDLVKAIKYDLNTAQSVEYVDAFQNWCDQFLLESEDLAMDAVYSLLTKSISDWYKTANTIVAGDDIENEMMELFYLNLQIAVSDTIFSIMDKYPNLLQADYSMEDIWNLTDLTLFYLKCGNHGFQYNYEENALSCIKAYQNLQKTKIPVQEQKIESIPTKIDNYNIPGNISVGDTYVIYGTITSDEDLSKVTVSIGNETKMIEETAQISGKIYDLHELDNKVALNKLSAGDYYYTVSADTMSGNHYELVCQPFSVWEENGDIIITGYKLPHPMLAGSKFNVIGNITSQSILQEVKVSIVNTEGKTITEGIANPESSTFNLAEVDRDVQFHILEPGTYYYKISAINLTGEEILVNQEFIVK